MATVNRIASQVLSVGQQTALASLSFTTEQMTLQAVAAQIGSADSQVRLVVRDTLGRVIKTNVIVGSDTQRSVITTDDLVQSGGLTAFIECLRGSATVVLNEITGQEGQGAAMALADIPDGLLTADAAGRAKLGDGFVNTAKLAGSAVTGAKLVQTGMKHLRFDGKNGAGAITLTGAAVGDRVLFILGVISASGVSVVGTIPTQFEATITVINQIQQADVADLSGNDYWVLLIPASA